MASSSVVTSIEAVGVELQRAVLVRYARGYTVASIAERVSLPIPIVRGVIADVAHFSRDRARCLLTAETHVLGRS